MFGYFFCQSQKFPAQKNAISSYLALGLDITFSSSVRWLVYFVSSTIRPKLYIRSFSKSGIFQI